MISKLRHERGLSQRQAASELKISQALLSHYENGAREPGLRFVCRACDYYGVSADYILGRTANPQPKRAAVNTPADAIAQIREIISELDQTNLSD